MFIPGVHQKLLLLIKGIEVILLIYNIIINHIQYVYFFRQFYWLGDVWIKDNIKLNNYLHKGIKQDLRTTLQGEDEGE